MRRESSAIPIYGLYGERLVRGDPGFVHIEDIATRSSPLGWLIKPHRHNRLFQILCVTDGELEVQLDDCVHHIVGSWIITIPAGVTHGFQFQPDSQGYVLSIADTILLEERDQGYDGSTSDLFLAPQLIELLKTDDHSDRFLDYLSLLKREFNDFTVGQNQSLTLISRLILLTLNRRLQHKRLRSFHSADRDLQILGRFRELIEEHYRDHWPVSDYADALHVSTSTLNRACRKTFAESPKSLIQDRLLAEAKRRLIYTQQSPEEIAYLLGFNDYPYFSRFFKLNAGVTPGNFRRKANESN